MFILRSDLWQHFVLVFGNLGVILVPFSHPWGDLGHLPERLGMKKRLESIPGNAFFEIGSLKGSILGPILEQFLHLSCFFFRMLF